MARAVAREKHYVRVLSCTDRDGTVIPLRIAWDDGRRFSVERVLDSRRAYSPRTGGGGVRYTVSVGGRITYLWYEDPRWFVEAKVPTSP